LETLLEALNDFCGIPARKPQCALRVPISGIYKIKGVGDVLTGRVEQGTLKAGDEVVFHYTHTSNLACHGKVFTLEMHHKRVETASTGDNFGVNIKGLEKHNMPRSGDVMTHKNDTTITRVT